MTTKIQQTVAAATDLKVDSHRDKYGRLVTVYTAYTLDPERENRYMKDTYRAVVCNLPKTAWERDGMKYLVNDWNKRGDEAVSYFSNRTEAHLKAIEIAVAARTAALSA